MNDPFPMTERKRKVIIAIIIIGFLLAFAVALTDTQPAGAAPNARVCMAWSKTCTHYRYFLGIRYCDAWLLTCVRYL
jgi:hypothetical protein